MEECDEEIVADSLGVLDTLGDSDGETVGDGVTPFPSRLRLKSECVVATGVETGVAAAEILLGISSVK